ncbi:MAG: OmpH family outer membrane protein [Bacteroidetes bacterium]|nr:MAG: OmpH family outer membrane protein [Bacteroidota bacterium]
MKKAITILFVALLISGMGFAQTNAKIGYIDSNQILTEMPQTDSLQKELKNYADYLDQQMQTMGQEYKKKAQDYQQNVAGMSDLIRQTKEKEITDLQQRIQAFQANADQDLQKKQQELFNPIIKQIKDAITDVGKENNYNYILDVGTGAVVFYQGDDVLPLVKKKLGIK